MIHDTVPFSIEKNLGKAYNQAINLIPDEDHICIRDGDTCWLTPDYGVHIDDYVKLYPNAILTCWTNRINEKSEQQYINKYFREESDIKDHLRLAESIKENLYQVTALHGFVSGFCLIVPKTVWKHHKFSEVQVYSDRGPNNLLGVDNDFTNRVRAAGIPVLRMDGIYIWHSYRLLNNSKDHLL